MIDDYLRRVLKWTYYAHPDEAVEVDLYLDCGHSDTTLALNAPREINAYWPCRECAEAGQAAGWPRDRSIAHG